MVANDCLYGILLQLFLSKIALQHMQLIQELKFLLDSVTLYLPDLLVYMPGRHSFFKMHFAVVLSAIVVVLLKGKTKSYWIGLTDREIRRQYRWVDNTEVTFTNWGPGEPNGGVGSRRVRMHAGLF